MKRIFSFLTLFIWLTAYGQSNVSSFRVPLGAAGTPSMSFQGDPNTGIFSLGADQVNISTGGVNRLSVSASGALHAGSITNLVPANALSISTQSNGVSGALNLSTADGTSGSGGDITIQGGSAAFGSGVSSGNINIFGGGSNTASSAGVITIRSGGVLTWGSGNASSLILEGGSAPSGNPGGGITIRSGGSSGQNGNINIFAKNGGTAGDIVIQGSSTIFRNNAGSDNGFFGSTGILTVPAGVNAPIFGAASISAGYVGEEKKITQTVYTNSTNGGWDNLGSVSLTSGVWVPCIKATVISTGSTTFSDAVIFGYSSDSGATTFTDRDGTLARSKEVSMSLPGIGVSYSNYRFAAGGCMPAFSVASTTTYYFKAFKVASAGNYDLVGSVLTFTRR